MSAAAPDTGADNGADNGAGTGPDKGADKGADRRATPALMLAALGIVYGDLGTSPLYTMQTVVGAAGTIDAGAALGLLSLIVWALLITVSVKYCLFVMRADNNGEGGILALMSLVTGNDPHRRWLLVAMGLFGAALLYGDGAITPAISVLSALEGVNVVTTALKPYVMPAAVAVLLALFAAQALGTARIGSVFGPVMLAWFAAIGVIGLIGVARHPAVLAAIDPRHAIGFLAHHGHGSLIVLGGVFLAVTGAEALYADMGSIGRHPIRAAWYGAVLPALLLSYAGQTALLMQGGVAKDANPFWLTVPQWAVAPMVVLATLATIIASQAIITGAFSLTRQAMQLGWLPGLRIRQTSDREYGQIYVPFVNWALMAVTLALTAAFGSSDRLAGAYGTAVSTTMLLTTALLFHAMTERWRWSAALAGAVAGGFLIVDLVFFAANLMKIADGGWIPLLLGVLLFTMMTTWRRGTDAARTRLGGAREEPARFLQRLIDGEIPRVPGTAVFLTGASRPVPAIMVRHVRDMGALHRSLVSLTLRFEERPRVPAAERVEIERVADGFWHLTAHFGFVEVPDLHAVLMDARERGCELDLDQAIYFGAHDEVVPAPPGERLLPAWRRMLFAFMHRNALRTFDRFQLPAQRFVEVGRQLKL